MNMKRFCTERFYTRNMNIKRRFMAYLNSYVISYYPGMASTSTSVSRKTPQPKEQESYIWSLWSPDIKHLWIDK